MEKMSWGDQGEDAIGYVQSNGRIKRLMWYNYAMYNHICIKPGCGKSYEDNDSDAYYCPSCQKERKKIAAEVDAKVAARPSRAQKSGIQQYDEAPKGPGGFIRVSL